MKTYKVKPSKANKPQKSSEFTRFEVAFAIRMVRTTPVTPERLAVAEGRASRARHAKSAEFLNQYRHKAAA